MGDYEVCVAYDFSVQEARASILLPRPTLKFEAEDSSIWPALIISPERDVHLMFDLTFDQDIK